MIKSNLMVRVGRCLGKGDAKTPKFNWSPKVFSLRLPSFFATNLPKTNWIFSQEFFSSGPPFFLTVIDPDSDILHPAPVPVDHVLHQVEYFIKISNVRTIFLDRWEWATSLRSKATLPLFDSCLFSFLLVVTFSVIVLPRLVWTKFSGNEWSVLFEQISEFLGNDCSVIALCCLGKYLSFWVLIALSCLSKYLSF